MRTLILAMAVLASACTGPVRSTATNSPTDMSQTEAENVLVVAMTNVFPDAAIEKVNIPGPMIRYQAKIAFGFDSHGIIAVAKPMNRGYVFEVSDYGSMPISGTSRATKLYEEINQQIQKTPPRRG